MKTQRLKILLFVLPLVFLGANSGKSGWMTVDDENPLYRHIRVCFRDPDGYDLRIEKEQKRLETLHNRSYRGKKIKIEFFDIESLEAGEILTNRIASLIRCDATDFVMFHGVETKEEEGIERFFTEREQKDTPPFSSSPMLLGEDPTVGERKRKRGSPGSANDDSEDGPTRKKQSIETPPLSGTPSDE